MASTASTQMIFFISAIVVASVVVAVASQSVYNLSSGISDKSKSVKDQMSTDIRIINDPTEVPNNPVLIYVKNIGTTVLNQNYISVMLDGAPVINYTLTLTGNHSSYWDPSSVLTISIGQDLAPGDHTVTVSTENGVSDQFSYRT